MMKVVVCLFYYVIAKDIHIGTTHIYSDNRQFAIHKANRQRERQYENSIGNHSGVLKKHKLLTLFSLRLQFVHHL